MGRLTEQDENGNWCVKGLPWKKLYAGNVIAEDTYASLYGCLAKLKDYENTGLDPDAVEKLLEDAEGKTHDIKPGDTVYFAWPVQGIVTDAIVKDVGTKYLIFEDFIEPLENIGIRVFKTEKEAVEALKEK